MKHYLYYSPMQANVNARLGFNRAFWRGIEYTEAITNEESKSNWDDAKLVAEVESEEKFLNGVHFKQNNYAHISFEKGF